MHQARRVGSSPFRAAVCQAQGGQRTLPADTRGSVNSIAATSGITRGHQQQQQHQQLWGEGSRDVRAPGGRERQW